MRNSTKLKLLLQRYSFHLDMNGDELFELMITDKKDNSGQQFEGKSYSAVLQKAYSYLLKKLNEEQLNQNF
jgi:hypothetical protein